jgi:hypothetical protein
VHSGRSVNSLSYFTSDRILIHNIGGISEALSNLLK